MKGFVALLLFCSYILLAFAVEEPVNIKGYQVKQLNAKEFHFSGQDPHIIYRYAADQLVDQQGVWLSINLSASKLTSIQAELFWRSHKYDFKPENKLEFSLNTGQNRIFIPLGLFADKINALRLDIDQCNCDVIIEPFRWQAIDSPVRAAIPDQIQQLINNTQSKEIPLAQWAGVNFKSIAEGEFDYGGGDPRIINIDALNIRPSDYRGIYLEFDFASSKQFEKFQIFWLLQGFSWGELRSSHFMLPNTGQTKKVFIPFGGLNAKRAIQSIRLDFESCKTCRLVLHNSKLIGFGELAKYQVYSPNYLTTTYSGNLRGSTVFKSFLRKFLQDPWFLGFYLLVLLLTSVFGVFLVIKQRH